MSESAYNSPLLSRKIAELSECSSAYSSPLLGRRFPESCFSSPARSIASSFGDPHSLTDSEFDDEHLELVTETPGQPDQTVVDGWVKFRDNKRWKQRWGVVTKLSPAADCLHLQLYRDSKDRYKQGQTKASLSLQHFLGVESGFTLDKESNTIAIICQDVIVVLAFDTRERLIQWQVKISANLGDDQQFLVLISSAPPKTKIASGPARMHVQDHRFCLTSGVPPRLMGIWEIGHLRRYGVVEGRFCFEGGSRCGKGEGLHVLVTDQGEEITDTLKSASQGTLAARRRPASRKTSNIDSPRRTHTRQETRISDLSCTESFLNSSQTTEMTRSIYGDDSCCNHNDQTPCTCRTSSPYWSTESATVHHNHGDLDSNYGCGDTASVSEMHDMVHNETWTSDMGYNGRGGIVPSMERCMSCISKLGAPSMSRSSTATASGTPGAPPLFSPAWTMENNSSCNLHAPQNSQPFNRSNAGSNSDRMSLCSHGSSSGNSEYSVPNRLPNMSNSQDQNAPWYERTHGVSTPPPLPVLPKSPKIQTVQSQTSTLTRGTSNQCQCCVPARPPKPVQLSTNSNGNSSPNKKPLKKPPMPLPLAAPLNGQNQGCHSCSHKPTEESNPMVGPYENYDVPKMPFLVEPKNEDGKRLVEIQEHYDTPKKIKECLAAEIFESIDSNTVNVRKPCGCILKFNKPTVFVEPKIVDNHEVIRPDDCPCRRVICWPGNWMTLPYCKRGSGIENTTPKGPQACAVSINGEGKMPVVQANGEMAIYATIDKSKKTNRKVQDCNNCCKNEKDVPCSKEDPISTNYVNIDPINLVPEPSEQHVTECANYANIDFAQSLEYYENARELLQRAGITKEEMEKLDSDIAREKLTFIMSNGVKVCNKCGHACQESNKNHRGDHQNGANQQQNGCQSENSNKEFLDDYLMMEPAKDNKKIPQKDSNTIQTNRNFPGYLPMSPVSNQTQQNCSNNKTDLLKQCVNKLICEKSASNPSLIGPAVDRSRKRSDSDLRIPGAAMLGIHHNGNSPYIRRHIMDSADSIDRKASFLARKRSSSADSTRYLDDEESLLSRTDSPSSETLRKSSVHSLNSTVEQLPCTEHRMSSPCIHQESEGCYDSDCCRKELTSNETEDEVSSTTTDSLRTQIPEGLSNQQSVNIRRSSSVPCKSGQNRDSSSSNDSGVSTGSLKQRGADFAEFELPLTTAMSSRRHHQSMTQQQAQNCLHSSLPRRSKSSDPLRELTFQFQKVKIPAKSSSAEAEVPICPAKTGKGYSSPSDGTMGPPYMDSRSTSSGTSDMSDYIETLSLSSHSSSDATDLRLIRPATTTLRPRSGKEYLNIDRAMLMSEGGKITGCGGSGQLRAALLAAQGYANITPVPEKSESPSPGYMSGSSPAQEMIPAQPFTFQKTQ